MGAVLLGIGLLIGWTWRISLRSAGCPSRKGDRSDLAGRREGAPKRTGPVTFPPGGPQMEPQPVARITAMADCRWIDPATEAFALEEVPLGRKFALASGLLEITYDSGAKVILQGPCMYEVESARGGFLSLGKLTASVERRAEGGGRRAEDEVDSGRVGSGQQIQNPESKIQDYSFRPPPSALRPFFCSHPHGHRDRLGTEFGVEVNRSGTSRAYVFQGKVELRPAASVNLPSPSGRGAGGEGTGLAILAVRQRVSAGGNGPRPGRHRDSAGGDNLARSLARCPGRPNRFEVWALVGSPPTNRLQALLPAELSPLALWERGRG